MFECLCVSVLPGRSFEFPADADVDLHGLQGPLLLWFDALNNNNTEQLGHRRTSQTSQDTGAVDSPL